MHFLLMDLVHSAFQTIIVVLLLLPPLLISNSPALQILRLYSSSCHSVMKLSQMLKLHNVFCSNSKVDPDTVK